MIITFSSIPATKKAGSHEPASKILVYRLFLASCLGSHSRLARKRWKSSHAYIGFIEFVVAKITSAKIQVAPAKISKDVFNYLM
jgi:hypothetical protein